jgi:HD-GYP domain-containing protein (c-di-GMP phosphodiesterase class II)
MLFGGELIGVLSVHEWGDTPRQFSADDAQLLQLLATQAAALVYNARLHDETERRAQQLALVYDAGLTLNSVLETETQLDFLTRIAMRSVHADFAVFFQYEEATGELVLEFGFGFSKEHPYLYRTRVPLDAEQGIEAWVARERVPVTLNDASADPRFMMSGDPLLAGIWVPIEHDKRLLGVLAVGVAKRNAFTPHDERLLLLYASQAAVALENARLYRNALQANERRAILHWASQEIISAGLDAERAYAAIHQAVSRLMPCDAFVIAVLEENDERIHLPHLVDRGEHHAPTTIPKRMGLSGHMLATGVSLMIDDLTSSDLQGIHFGSPEQVLSVLAVPLRHGGQVFGMLSAQSYQRRAYSADHRVMLEMLAAHAAAALMNMRGAERMLQSLERAYLETALALAKTIDTRDSYTGAHSDRIADMAEAVGVIMGLSGDEIHALRLGARLHDIGKIGVPDDILRKPGPLTEAEWELMHRHPEVGAEILKLVRPLDKVLPLVKHHQERFDGTGYPAHLSGEMIPLGARILAVVDAFSAMTDDRAYRKGRSVQEALAELKEYAGTQFDPDVVKAFLQLWA